MLGGRWGKHDLCLSQELWTGPQDPYYLRGGTRWGGVCRMQMPLPDQSAGASLKLFLAGGRAGKQGSGLQATAWGMEAQGWL